MKTCKISAGIALVLAAFAGSVRAQTPEGVSEDAWAKIEDHIREDQYSFRANKGELAALNPAQDFRVCALNNGLCVTGPGLLTMRAVSLNCSGVSRRSDRRRVALRASGHLATLSPTWKTDSEIALPTAEPDPLTCLQNAVLLGVRPLTFRRETGSDLDFSCSEAKEKSTGLTLSEWRLKVKALTPSHAVQKNVYCRWLNAYAEPRANGRRVEYYRGPVVEWYENRPDGLEQGFTILEAEHSGSLRLGVRIRRVALQWPRCTDNQPVVCRQ